MLLSLLTIFNFGLEAAESESLPFSGSNSRLSSSVAKPPADPLFSCIASSSNRSFRQGTAVDPPGASYDKSKFTVTYNQTMAPLLGCEPANVLSRDQTCLAPSLTSLISSSA